MAGVAKTLNIFQQKWAFIAYKYYDPVIIGEVLRSNLDTSERQKFKRGTVGRVVASNSWESGFESFDWKLYLNTSGIFW